MSSDYVVQKHWRATQERIQKFISEEYFADVNLRGRLYSASAPLDLVKWYAAPGNSVPTFGKAKHGLETRGKDITARIKGFNIGPTWSTHWFECHGTIPKEWEGQQVRFRWDSCSEAMVWVNGEPKQGLTGSSDKHQIRTDFILTTSATPGQKFLLYVEVACNGMFGAGRDGLINPPNPDKTFTVSMAEMGVFQEGVYQLLMDMTVLYDLTKELSQDSPRAYEALYAANKIINICNPFDESTFKDCFKISSKFFNERNGKSQQTVHVMGHCHIDSAWLWPYSETRRKCGRSWSSVVALMDRYPELTFVCSQAQQLEWVKEDYPALFSKILGKAKAGQFIPVGATWIEMDGNIPGGESFIRQFLLGQSFFKKEFGRHCTEFWLPDTFGYSPQIPQIMAGVGVRHFLTQKLSWNLTNKFPHTSFMWEGIDGTSVLCHMPPADTYESCADVKDLLKSVKENKDKGRSRQSVLLYGHGDGGGGPTEDMMESMRRLRDVDGVPRVQHSTPNHFFSQLECHDKPNLCKWVGELYLELHRGTYTSQAKLKLENRRGEFLFHNVDFITAVNFLLGGTPAGEMAMVQVSMLPLWKKFLLNQFHDVIPGSCIRKVAEDAEKIYQEIKGDLELIFYLHLHKVVNKRPTVHDSSTECRVIVNSFSWERKGVVSVYDEGTSQSKKLKLSAEAEGESLQQIDSTGCMLQYIQVPAMSIGSITHTRPNSAVVVTMNKESGHFLFENSVLRAVVTSKGLLSSLVHKETSRDAISEKSFGNQFVLFDDVPLFWDAWDVMEYHLETRNAIAGLQDATSEEGDGLHIQILEPGPLRATVEVSLAISASSKIKQRIVLEADSPCLKFVTEVDWHESHKFLKVEFPFNIHAHEANYEVQFGHYARPNHFNTSWNQAQFEVCGQKWADLSEHGFGVALLNDCKYGYSTLGNVMRLSLLRSPKAPDGQCDIGHHSFCYAVMPHKGTFQESGVIQEAYNLNQPLFVVDCNQPVGPGLSLLAVDNPAVVIETLKLCEDIQSKAGLLVRVYEAHGCHTTATLTCPLAKGFERCNLLEEVKDDKVDGTLLNLTLHPFEIASFIVNL